MLMTASLYSILCSSFTGFPLASCSDSCLSLKNFRSYKLLLQAEKDYKLEMENKSWQYSIPDDVLSCISDFLPLADFVIFRSVCRTWRNCPSPRASIVEFSLKDVWCIMYDFDARDRDMCLFYQVKNRKRCIVKLPNLRGATCLVSKHRWLLIRRSNNYMFFNPLTLEEIQLPPYPAPPLDSTACQVGTFSVAPTSQNCYVVLLSSRDPLTIEIAYCHMANKKWFVNKANIDAGDVAIGYTLLPDPVCIQLFSCHNFRGSIIILSYKTHWIWSIISGQTIHTSEMGSIQLKYDCDQMPQLVEAHSDDWLSKFGGEVSFSFALFSDMTKVDGWSVFGSEAQTVAGAPVVKATWI